MSTDHDAFWMPFGANRPFKKSPRVLVGVTGDITVQRLPIDPFVDTPRTTLRRTA